MCDCSTQLLFLHNSNVSCCFKACRSLLSYIKFPCVCVFAPHTHTLHCQHSKLTDPTCTVGFTSCLYENILTNLKSIFAFLLWKCFGPLSCVRSNGHHTRHWINFAELGHMMFFPTGVFLAHEKLSVYFSVSVSVFIFGVFFVVFLTFGLHGALLLWMQC